MSSEPEPGEDASACWCCGDPRDADDLVRLQCHPEVALCDTCVGWLAERAGRAGVQVRRAIPILVTTDFERALRHYAALGFETEQWEGGAYGFLARDGVELHIGQLGGTDRPASGVSVYLHVADAARLHAEWMAAGVDGVLVAPTDMPYGLREGHHIDPDGNLIRFASPIPSDSPSDGSTTIAADDPLARVATGAVQSGDVDALERLLREHPDLARARIGDAAMSRTLLHAATDWPGHYPNVGRTISALVDAGADVDARFHGPHKETPLHWAASNDDVEALDALLDAGADIEASGAVLGGGAPLADACGFAQWNVARRLVERGASTSLGEAAALGLLDRVREALDAEPPPPAEEVTRGLWMACHGGRLEAAEILLDRGPDIDWIGWDHLTPLDAATRSGAADLVAALRERGARTLAELRESPA